MEETMNFKKKELGILLGIMFAAGLTAVTGADVLKGIDKNEFYGTIKFNAKMIIKRYGRTRTKDMKIYGKGRDKSFVHLLNPEDKGTRYLKVKDALWIYIPTAEGVQKISGHYLKQGMMGSDVSYEDALNNDTLIDLYTAKIVGSEKFLNWECYVVELSAKKRRAPYKKQKIWVSKTHTIIVKSLKYAGSGKLLKEEKVLKIEKVGHRNVAVKSMVIDKKYRDSSTTFIMSNVRFDIAIPDSIFSKKNLER